MRPILSIVVLAISTSCRSAAPTPAIDAASRLDAQSLEGRWLAKLTTNNVSDFNVLMTFDKKGIDRYEGYSRSGALRQNIGSRQYFFGRLLGKLPPHLAVVFVDSVAMTSRGDSTLVHGVIRSPVLGNFRMDGSLTGDRVHGDLRRDEGSAVVGSVELQRSNTAGPLRDYPAVARAIRDTMAAYIFDPRMMERQSWKEFFAELDARFREARDDADAMTAFYALTPRLETTHMDLTHDSRLAGMSIDSALMKVSAPPESLVTLTFPVPGVAYLYVRHWEQVTPAIDRAFVRIDSARAHTLMIDIRGNPGGDHTSLMPAAHLFRDSVYAGVLLSNKWYRDHRAPPTAEQVSALPRESRDDLLSVVHMLRDRGTVVGIVPPRQPYFAGKVFLLTNSGTASASEPLAYLLKHTKRATLVGEPTAGAMLSAIPHPVGQGWVFILPEADYYTADGVRIEGRGVTPDVQVPWRDAIRVVADSVRARSPYAAALLAGMSATQGRTADNLAERAAESERWAREAVRIAPDSIAAIAALGNALISQKKWNAGFAAWDSLLSANPDRTVVLYQIGRFAALSGQRLEDGERALRKYLRGSPPVGAPSLAGAHWRLGMILEKKGERDEARKEYEAGLALEPGNADIRASLNAVPRL